MASGIFIKILPQLEMAALASVVSQLKGIMSKGGAEAAAALNDPQLAALKTLESEVTASANRMAAAEIRAAKLAGDAQVEQARRGVAAQSGLAKAAEDRTAAEMAAINAIAYKQAKSTQASKEATQAQEAHVANQAKYDAALAASTNVTTKFGGSLNAMGMAATGAFAVIGGFAGKEAMDYEAGMTKIQASSHQTASVMKELHDGILNLGPQVGQTMQSLNEAAYSVEKAQNSIKGLQDPATRAAGTLSILKAASQLAAVEGTDLNTAVGGLLTTMSDYHISADQAATVASKFRAAIGDSRSTVQEFMGALHSIEPVAATAGVGIEQVMTMLARMTQNGMSADQAADNLRNALNHLTNPTQQQAQNLAQLGLNAATLAKSLSDPNVGMIGVLDQMHDAMMKHLDSKGMVVFDAMYKNQQTLANYNSMFSQLSPEMQNYAKQAEAGTLDKKLLNTLKQEGPEASKLKAVLKAYSDMTGYNKMLGQNKDLERTLAQTWKDLTGTQLGQLAGIMTSGNPQNQEDTRKTMEDVNKASADAKGNVEGWSQVQDTLSQKLKETNAALQQMAVKMGEALLPVLKDFAGALKDIFGFLSNHEGILKGIIITLGSMAVAWTAVKTAMIFNTVFDALTKGIALVITRFDVLKDHVALTNTEMTASGAAAAKGAAGVEAAAASETAAIDGVTAAARTAAAAISSIAAGVLVGVPVANSVIHSQWLKNFELHNPLAQNPLSRWANKHTPSWLGGDPGWDASQVNGGGGSFDNAWNQGKHWEIGKGWVDDSAATPTQTGDTPIPDTAVGPDSPSQFSPDTGGTPWGGSGPSGKKNDPLYVAPSIDTGLGDVNGMGMGGSYSGYNPLTQLASGGFTLKNIAEVMTTFLAQLALGNPLGKLKTGQASQYAWWYNGGGDGSVNDTQFDPNMLQATADQINGMTDQQRADMENTLALQKAVRGYQHQLQHYAAVVAKYGKGSYQEQSALESLLNAKDSITQTMVSQRNRESRAAANGLGAKVPGLPLDLQQAYGYDTSAYTSSNVTPAGPGAEGWRNTVAQVVDQYGAKAGINLTPENRQKWINAIVSQIDTESKGNPNADNPHDSNGRGGTQHVAGLLQYLPSSYASSGGALTGLPYMDPVGQIAGALFAPRNPDGSPATTAPGSIGQGHGWGPSGGFNPATGGGSSGPGWFDNGIVKAPLGGGQGFPLPWKLGGGPATPRIGPGNGNSIFGPAAMGGGGGSSLPGLGAGLGASASSGGGLGNALQSQPMGTGNTSPGFGISGGALGAAEGAASMAADAFAPGSGAVMNLATQEANRFAGYLGQLGGIAAEGVLETFALNDSPLADPSKSLPGKVIFGLAGAHPNKPNTAGQTAPPLKPQDAKGGTQHQGTGQPPGPLINIENQNFNGNADSGEVNREQNRNLMQAGLVG